MTTITDIQGEEIRDSRGMPTLSITVTTEKGRGTFSVPSGASTGANEAHELRDEGGGMSTALKRIREDVAPAIVGMNVEKQSDIDALLQSIDGTSHFSHIGGNTAIGVSVAVAKAAAASRSLEVYQYLRTLGAPPASRRIPLLVVNMFNGGKHAPGGTPFQEHQIIPYTEDLGEALAIIGRVRATLERMLLSRGKQIGEGDEGGYSSSVEDEREPFQMLKEALAREHLEDRVLLGADIAASSIEREGDGYKLLNGTRSPEEMIALYQELALSCGLSHIEDPFSENELKHFSALRAALPEATIIGDDLTTTHAERIQEAGENMCINAVIIKPNQNGTLTGAIQAVMAARERGMHCIASHRSGETMDDFIADFAFAFGCYGLKAGAPHKPERAVKYQRLRTIAL